VPTVDGSDPPSGAVAGSIAAFGSVAGLRSVAGLAAVGRFGAAWGLGSGACFGLTCTLPQVEVLGACVAAASGAAGVVS